MRIAWFGLRLDRPADVSTHPGPHERLDTAEGRPRRFFDGHLAGLEPPISTPDLAADWSQCFVSIALHFSMTTPSSLLLPFSLFTGYAGCHITHPSPPPKKKLILSFL